MIKVNYSELPHIKELIEQNDIHLTSWEENEAFNKHICDNYPWVAVMYDSIDWDMVNQAIRLDLLHANDNQVLDFIEQTRLGKHTHGAISYGIKKPCLVCELPLIAKNLDTFLSGNIYYVFGVELDEAKNYHYFFDDFIEYDFDDGFWLSGIKQS